MSKKKNNEFEEEEYYLPDDEEEVSENEEVKKPSGTNDKKLELAILKEQNKAKQLENEAKKLEFDKAEAEKKHEFEDKKLEIETRLEERKIAVTEKANSIAEDQIKADAKQKKRDRILGYVKAAAGIAGVALSTAIGIKKFHEGMKFEETDSFTSATGKDGSNSLNDNLKDLKNLDKKF